MNWSTISGSRRASPAGGGTKKIEKQHRDGKLTARERIGHLIDPGTLFLEIGLLIAYDQYDGQAPAAGVVTGSVKIEGRPAVIVANDATVKAGAWWPETITKILRAQEIAMRNRVPIVYLVDSAGVNLPLQDGIFPGQYGAARIFYYNSLMRRRLQIPQIAAVMGPCIAGGAYLPALSDVIIMVEKVSFMGLGGPNLVKGAVGQVIGCRNAGRRAHAHRASAAWRITGAKDDRECLELIRAAVSPDAAAEGRLQRDAPPPAAAEGLYDVLPADHRLPYDMEDLLERLLDGDDFLEFQPEYAPEILCANARALHGRPIGVIANRRGFLKSHGKAPYRRHRVHRIGAKGSVFRRECRAPALAASLFAGRLGIHGRRGGGKRRHHSRGRGNGRNHGLRDRSQDRRSR